MFDGTARLLEGADAKLRAMDRFIDRFYPERSKLLRAPTASETKAMDFVVMEIEQASAKIRETHVADDEADYALPIWSRSLGLSGRCDVVEFYPDGTVFPVEYKHGKKQKWLNDDLQLAAQAICLEEMLTITISRGAIFHKGSMHRREVEFTVELRKLVEDTTAAIHNLLDSGCLPPPINNQRCPECSLKNVCLPAVVADKARYSRAAKQLFIP